jgi:uncharacterized protein
MSRLTIVGASVRAAAESVRRAGLDPWCADLFADADLRALVPNAVRCPAGQYPQGLLDILRDAPTGPWMYTGALENHPNLIRKMAEVRPLWGNGPKAVAACRSPFGIERALREEGLCVPEVRTTDAELPDYCRWLRKPLAGAGGRGIAFADVCPSPASKRAHFFQQYVPGPAMSAVFVRARSEIRLLGVTEQLVGTDWLDAPPFRYAGNVGPVAVTGDVRDDLSRIGLVLGERCNLLGLFGVDFVLHDGRPWVIEVNPRYPASVEVLELATGVSAVALHATAFDPDAVSGRMGMAMEPVFGKAVLYASGRLIMSDGATGLLLNRGDDVTWWFADVPPAGEVIEPGWPVLTVVASGPTPEGCLHTLAKRTRLAKRILGNKYVDPPPPRTWPEGLHDPSAD